MLLPARLVREGTDKSSKEWKGTPRIRHSLRKDLPCNFKNTDKNGYIFRNMWFIKSWVNKKFKSPIIIKNRAAIKTLCSKEIDGFLSLTRLSRTSPFHSYVSCNTAKEAGAFAHDKDTPDGNAIRNINRMENHQPVLKICRDAKQASADQTQRRKENSGCCPFRYF